MNVEPECVVPGKGNKFNLKDLLQDVCKSEMIEIKENINAIFQELDFFRHQTEYLDEEIKDNYWLLEMRIKDLEEELNSSNPTSDAFDHSQYQEHRGLAGSRSQLSPYNEKHQPRDLCNHETAYPHTLGTFHYIASDSSQDISSHAHIFSHQTSTWKGSFGPLLCRIQEKALELPGSLVPSAAQIQALSSHWSIPVLEYHVVLQADHIHIQFRDGNHPESVHSVLILHPNFHSS